MKKILLLFLLSVPFYVSAQSITATCYKVTDKLGTIDQDHPATITITLTDQQPDPELYTLEGNYFMTVCIKDKASPDKIIFFDAFDKNSKVEYISSFEEVYSNLFLFSMGIYEEPFLFTTLNDSLLLVEVLSNHDQQYVINYLYPDVWNVFLKMAMESLGNKL